MATVTDWIKMRTDLYRDPKVCLMAEILTRPNGPFASHVSRYMSRDMVVTRHVMRHAVVGALNTVWGVARLRGKREGTHLVIRGATIDVINDIADMPGFGEAMREVGWVNEADGSVIFPRFYEELNTDPETSKKAADAERQRLHRQKKRDMSRNASRDSHSDTMRDSHSDSHVTVTDKCHITEEKRREEKNTSSADKPAGEILKTDDPKLDVKSEPPPKPPRPKKEKPVNPDTRTAIAFFLDMWAAAYREKFPMAKTHAGMLENIFERCQSDLGKYKPAIHRFFEDRTEFTVSTRHSVELLSKNLHKYLPAGGPLPTQTRANADSNHRNLSPTDV